MIKLNAQNYMQFLRGASILTTGGGLSYVEQIKSIKNIENFAVQIKPVTDFPSSSNFIMVAEAGRSDAPPIKKKKIINEMFNYMLKITQKEITGIYPFEIGQESITLESAFYLNLPVVDFDSAGCRAVPFFDINIFTLNKLNYSFSPLVLCTDRKEIFILPKPDKTERTEEILREMVSLSKTSIIFFLGGIISASEIMKHNLHKSLPYNKAYELGSADDIRSLSKTLHPKLLLDVSVLKKEVIDQKGFLCQKVYLKERNGKKYVLYILNETIAITDIHKKILAVVPERILMINSKTLIGVSSENLKNGFHFLIAVLEPEKEWQVAKAVELFGESRFSFLLSK